MSGARAVETAHAKINLALHVRRRRPDGYHDIETLFAFCADGDEVTAAPAETCSLAVIGPFAAGLSVDEDNLVLRAARAYRAAFGGDDMAFMLDKRLPIASGIGGGSADAAAAIRLLCRRDGRDPRGGEVLRQAAMLGADVPACLLSRTCRGDGRGDRLAAIDARALSGVPVLLVNPRVAVSTAAVFAGWDGVDRGALPAGDPLTVALSARNDLEPPARGLAPIVDEVVGRLAACERVRLARMSGSGATCFALFADSAARDAAATSIAAARPDWWLLASALL